MKSLLTLITILLYTSLSANITMPAIFSDHMVMQRNSEVKIWGWAKAGENITLTTSWSTDTLSTRTDSYGNWHVMVNTPEAGGAHEIKIKGYNQVNISDIMFGEVWLVSGQSNMEWSPNAGIDHGDYEIPLASYPNIRLFSVQHRSARSTQLNLDGNWVACTPQTMRHFSAIAYFFARQLTFELNVPIGIINSSWGGTPAEAWTPKDAIDADDILRKAESTMKEVPWGPVRAGTIFNAMIAPLIPFKIAGTLWYQGEANVENPTSYNLLLSTMINEWRGRWEDDFPFYFAQIAPFKYGRPYEGVIVRDEQRKTLSLPNTGMVVISDIGNIENIHPRNKIDVGKRFAKLALTKHYGLNEDDVSGPLFTNFECKKGKMQVYFANSDGLHFKNGLSTGFEIAGKDEMFHAAQAEIKDNMIILQSSEVKKPIAVRFAWGNIAESTLFNKVDLPASSFRSDDWIINFEK